MCFIAVPTFLGFSLSGQASTSQPNSGNAESTTNNSSNSSENTSENISSRRLGDDVEFDFD
jgi:hypothetical protein